MTNLLAAVDSSAPFNLLDNGILGLRYWCSWVRILGKAVGSLRLRQGCLGCDVGIGDDEGAGRGDVNGWRKVLYEMSMG